MKRWSMWLLLLPVAACTGILGLDDYYQANGAGGSGASGAGGAGTGGSGTGGGAGGALPCGDGPPCGACQKCGAESACEPVPWGTVDPAGECVGAGQTCDAAGHCVAPPKVMTGAGDEVHVHAMRAVDVPGSWAAGALVAGTMSGALEYANASLASAINGDGFALRVKDQLDVGSGAVLQSFDGSNVQHVYGVGSASAGKLWAAGWVDGGTIEGQSQSGPASWLLVHDFAGKNVATSPWIYGNATMSAADALPDGQAIVVAGEIKSLAPPPSFGTSCPPPEGAWAAGDSYVAVFKGCDAIDCQCDFIGQLRGGSHSMDAVTITGGKLIYSIWVAGHAVGGAVNIWSSEGALPAMAQAPGERVFVAKLKSNDLPDLMVTTTGATKGPPAMAPAALNSVLVAGWFDGNIEFPGGEALQVADGEGRDLYLVHIGSDLQQQGAAVQVHHEDDVSKPAPVLGLAVHEGDPARVALVGHLAGRVRFDPGAPLSGDAGTRNLLLAEIIYDADNPVLSYLGVFPVGNALDGAEVHAAYAVGASPPVLLLATDYGDPFDFAGSPIDLPQGAQRGLLLARLEMLAGP